MGQLIIDHSGYNKKAGTLYGLNEFTTLSCVHCQAVIVTFQRGCTQYTISATNVLSDVFTVDALPSEATEAHGCQKCGQLICTPCAFRMSVYGCPGPYKAQFEKAVEAKENTQG